MYEYGFLGMELAKKEEHIMLCATHHSNSIIIRNMTFGETRSKA